MEPSGSLALLEQPPISSSSSSPRWNKGRHGGGSPSLSRPRIGEPSSSKDTSLLALRPASIAPQATSLAFESANPEQPRSHTTTARQPRGGRLRGGRGNMDGASAPARPDAGARRGGRNGGKELRRNYSNVNVHTASKDQGRQWGGRLTTNASNAANSSVPSSTTLNADAPEFTPGKRHEQRFSRALSAPQNQNNQGQRIKKLRRVSINKSNAPDIGTRTHEDIDAGVYECAICTGEIERNSKVWSCQTCWTVFHLSCVKKWSQNDGSTFAGQQDELQPRQWRCPGCNLPKDDLPSNYSCWCEKEPDPQPLSGLPPHSCGQTCGRPRVLPRKCPHPCDLICHAGPCPPCLHLGFAQSCFCGKKSTSKRCADTNYDTGWSCSQICGDLMPCGEHTCTSPCHEGLCGVCEVELNARCYCGAASAVIKCWRRGDEKESKTQAADAVGNEITETWIGLFDCESTCGRLFDCGKHMCKRSCHPQELNPPHCPQSADVITTCPCGKKNIAEILTNTRETCIDPVPNCQEECSKLLYCGHHCQQNCHSGKCMPCLRNVTINCRCGRTISTICHQSQEEPPQCMRVCKATLNCGRHECGDRCCQGERKSQLRLSSKRKLRPLGSMSRGVDESFEAEHICTRLCGRALRCGNHACPDLCHKGPCGSCREAIFDEISCNCGRTVLQPPLACGTTQPVCRYDCERPKTCGHPQTPHNCHGEEESCPKCPFLTKKDCMCGKRALNNQPCWLTDVRCGEICGRKLKCGSHRCRLPCHRPGGCEDAGETCRQSCGKRKRTCGHPCEEPCHAPSSCRENNACQSKRLITCNCQNRKTETACLASRTNPDNNEKSLKCDDECARLERNRNLAEALDINPETHKDDHIPYSTTTLRMYHDSTKWAQEREREFRLFAADALEKRLRFKPMQSHQRAFIHALAEDFGFDSESLDPEPYRHVVIFKTPRFVMAPMKSLSDCLQIRLAAVEASTFTAATTSLGSNTQSNDEQYNGFLLVEPRFGLTLDELRADFFPIFITAPSLVFDISFLPSEKIVIKGRPTKSWAMSATTLGYNVKSLKSALLATATSKKIAASLILCALDSSLNILRLENDSTLKSGGWSQVAAKAASSARSAPMQSSVGVRSSFTVLGTKGIKKKKEEAKSRVVDDWEEAARREEEWELEQERLEMSHTLESGGGGGAKASGLVQCAPCAGDDALS